MKLAKFTTS